MSSNDQTAPQSPCTQIEAPEAPSSKQGRARDDNNLKSIYEGSRRRSSNASSTKNDGRSQRLTQNAEINATPAVSPAKSGDLRCQRRPEAPDHLRRAPVLGKTLLHDAPVVVIQMAPWSLRHVNRPSVIPVPTGKTMAVANSKCKGFRRALRLLIQPAKQLFDLYPELFINQDKSPLN